MEEVVWICGTCRGQGRRALGWCPLLEEAVSREAVSSVVWGQCQGVMELRRSYWVGAWRVLEEVEMGRDRWMQLIW